MLVKTVLVRPNGAKEFRTEAELVYTSDDCIGECVGETMRLAKAIGIDLTDDANLAAHEVNVTFCQASRMMTSEECAAMEAETAEAYARFDALFGVTR